MLPADICQVPGRDPAFMEAIDKNMRVPQCLSMCPEEHHDGEAPRRFPQPLPVYTMQVPHRLTYTEAPDMSPRSLFSPSKLSPGPGLGPGAAGLDPYCWEAPSGDMFYRDTLQGPIRRSLSDQSFGRTPPGTPIHLKQALVLPTHLGSAPPFYCRSPIMAVDPQIEAPPPDSAPLSLLFPQCVLQVAKQVGLQASQHLLQNITHRYRCNQPQRSPHPPATEANPPDPLDYNNKRCMESWSPEEEGGGAVEFIVLRRQVMKMNRRLAALERLNLERRNTEVVLMSLLMSACVLNAWLWIRR